MAGVFAGGQTHSGSFRADRVSLLIAGVAARGLILQNLSFSFTQQVAMLYEIGSNLVYYVGGRAQGTAGIGQILGPSRIGAKFICLYGDLCTPNDLQFAANSGCSPSTAGSLKYTLQSAVMVGTGVDTNAQSIVINQNSQFLFANLDYSNGASSDPCGAQVSPGGGSGGAFNPTSVVGNQIPGIGGTGGGGIGAQDPSLPPITTAPDKPLGFPPPNNPDLPILDLPNEPPRLGGGGGGQLNFFTGIDGGGPLPG